MSRKISSIMINFPCEFTTSWNFYVSILDQNIQRVFGQFYEEIFGWFYGV
jgi:hypothetical protein